MIKIGIVEDDLFYKTQLVEYFKDSSKIECLYSAKDSESFLKYYTPQNKIDVLLVDIALPGMNGIQLIELISKRYPKISCIALTIHKSDTNIQRALTAGAVGYLLKSLSFEMIEHKLVHYIKAAAPPLSPEATQSIINYFHSKEFKFSTHSTDHTRIPNFTHKEKIVIKLLLEGEPYKVIADFLSISVNGVRYYVKMVYKKVNVNSRAQLMKKVLYDKKIKEVIDELDTP